MNKTTMYSRLQLWIIGLGLGLFSSIIGAIVFNYFYFRRLDSEGIEYHYIDKRASIWGALFGTAITAVIVLSITGV